MKTRHSVNVERRAVQVIEDILGQVPHLEIKDIEREVDNALDHRIDLLIRARFAGKPLSLAVEIKGNGQPRNVRGAAQQLHRYVRDLDKPAVPIVMAPYLSLQARDACREEQVGYLDFMGNALIAFDTVYIERQVQGRPEPERRALRSLYKPKSARILRLLLSDPAKSWRTAELAEAAKVSTGLVSTIGVKLRERGWAEQTDHGLILTDPGDLLDSWAENYEPPRGEEHRRYSAYHGHTLAERLSGLGTESGRVALSSFSAAQWLAPFVRHPNTYFYADEAGLAALGDLLDLSDAPKGGNVVVVVPEEDGVLDDAVPVSDGLIATSPVQTYLDLLQAGDRGTEGAVELRHHLMNWDR